MYKLELNVENSSISTLKHLRACLGRRIDRVVVSDFHSRGLLKYTSELLEGVLFKKLVLKIKTLTSNVA